MAHNKHEQTLAVIMMLISIITIILFICNII